MEMQIGRTDSLVDFMHSVEAWSTNRLANVSVIFPSDRAARVIQAVLKP